MVRRVAQFANLVVKFGKDDLLDHSAIVLRAFLNDTHIRGYGRTHYHFLDVSLEKADPNDASSLVVVGRFVKNTVLEREQILAGGKLLADHQEIESAPSSAFLLVLKTHRMIFVQETKFAPTLSEFESTLRRFITKEFEENLRKVYEHEKAQNPKYTWKDARRANPAPSVSVVPLTSRSSISNFISRFSKIDTLSIPLIDRNSDFDAGAAAANFQRALSPMEPRRAVTKVYGGEDGLGISETEEFVKKTTESGYENVTITGLDRAGNKLKGNNDSYKLAAEVDLEGREPRGYVSALYQRYSGLVRDGVLRIFRGDESSEAEIVAKLQAIADEKD